MQSPFRQTTTWKLPQCGEILQFKTRWTLNPPVFIKRRSQGKVHFPVFLIRGPQDLEQQFLDSTHVIL